MKKSLLLFSGGQDSTTALAWSLKKFDEVYLISFDYGQRHIIEIKTATTIIATVTIVGSHKLTDASTNNPNTDILAIFTDATFHPIIKIKVMIIGQGIQSNKSMSFPSIILKKLI